MPKRRSSTHAFAQTAACDAALAATLSEVAMIEPAQRLSPIDLVERGAPGRRLCKAVVAGLPGDIALRELAIVKKSMNWPEESFQVRQIPADQGPDNIVTIEIAHEHVTDVFTGFGQPGVRAEAVAEDALQQARKYLAAGAPVSEHLADQLVIPFALAGGGSFITQPLTDHTTTNIDVVRRFLAVQIAIAPIGANRWKISFARYE